MIDIDQIMAYENGDMSEEEVIEMFQVLIDSGMAWQLQGHYGRMAALLIDAGHCTCKANEKTVE